MQKQEPVPVDLKIESILGDYAQFVLGEQTLLARISKAIDNGELLVTNEGKLTLPQSATRPHSNWHFIKPEGSEKLQRPSCRLLKDVLHNIVYAQTAIPLGCRHCYKVKVEVQTLSQLMTLKGLLPQIPCYSKCGSESHLRHNQSLWGAFFYAEGLQSAHDICHQVRNLLQSQPSLDKNAKVAIKRGCTEYEMALGPSDQWQFNESLQDLENYLESIFVVPAKDSSNRLTIFSVWLEKAFMLGDDTYLEFTRGKRLCPKTVDYASKSSDEL
jgi:hypothetical protein